ncbi:MFS transporter [Solwaraspora sp. WMMD1047]|uniref:MFS transporter n=1 Tax=Solwaraspora sp. WMMD1047 TaxID=3016102 RepID=UPI0024162139|nr:MFS transporter [Solwaraspora sp. WMMD1047]MDG4829904.1 MFS transporter [Solwaraspora sp. WMMD1047]
MSRRWKVLTVTSAAVFMALLDVTIVNIALPDLRQTFPDDSLSDLSWVLSAYNVVFAAALVPAGRLADRLGRRRLFLAGTVTFLAASLACGLAGSLGLLIAARIVQALGAAVLVPTSLGLVLPEFPPRLRATATGIWTATGAIAAATGPSLGGLLVDLQGWRWVFFVNLLIGAPLLILSRRLLRESRDELATRWPDWLGALLLGGAVAAVALVLVEGERWGWTSARVVGGVVAGGVLFLAFVGRSARHPEPVIEPALLRIRSFMAANTGSFVFGMGFYALLICNVLFLTGVWGYGILLAGAALTPGPIAATMAAPIAGRLADRYGPRAVAVPGALLFGAGTFYLMAVVGAEAAYLTAFLPGSVVTGAGVGLCLPAFGSAAVAEIPRDRFATAVAIASCFRQLGAVVGIAALVAVLGAGDRPESLASFQRGFLLIGVTGLLTLVSAVALGRIRSRDVAGLSDQPARPAETADPAARSAVAADRAE